MRPEDSPAWDLGLNMPLSDDAEADFREIEAIAAFLHELAVRTKREFVIGVSDPATGLAEDLIFVDEGEVDLDGLRRAFGSPEDRAR
jgi:hypothetical protein